MLNMVEVFFFRYCMRVASYVRTSLQIWIRGELVLRDRDERDEGNIEGNLFALVLIHGITIIDRLLEHLLVKIAIW